MKTILEEITQVLEEAFAACGYEPRFGKASLSNRPDLCEYQCNGAMAAAKAYRKAPIQIASAVAERLTGNPLFQEVSAVNPGFLNLKLSETALAAYLNRMQEEERLGWFFCPLIFG